ncbi:SurA N-terminal domain-containing protein [Gammaproteobacteria bacterium]|nr:SurA N-terminal domain-containing protein [Gammaproteobacteria bacterium]
MLDSFRTNMRTFALGIVIVIGFIFAFSGTGTMFLSGNSGDAAVVVGGEIIREIDVLRSISRQKQRILSENEGLDPSVLDDSLIRPSAVEQLISRQLLVQASGDRRMTVSPREVDRYILDIESFQTDGVFDQDLYKFAILNQGYTSADFKQQVKNDILIQQLVQGLTDTAFTTDGELAALAAVTEQQRNYYYLTVPADEIRSSITLTEAQVNEFYEANKATYQTEPKVSVDYIELSSDILADPALITEDLVAARFEEEILSRDMAESRQAAHILLEDPANELVAEIQAKLDDGQDFARLASEYSVDFGSAETGGDLGYTSGDTFPEEFEKALKSLSIGSVSTPVKTDSGTHFIKLLDIQQQSFVLAEETPRITRDLMLEATTDTLVAKLELLKELSFNAESLAEVAEDVGLEMVTSEAFTQTGGEGIAAIPSVIRAAFSTEVVEDKFASEVIDLGNDRYVVVKLNEYYEARQQELTEVRDLLETTYTQQLVEETLADKGASLAARVEAGETIEVVAKSEGLDWQVGMSMTRRSRDVNSEINAKIFSLPVPADDSSVQTFSTSAGDLIVSSLINVTPGDVSALSSDEKASLASATLSINGNRDIQAFEAIVRADTEIVQ